MKKIICLIFSTAIIFFTAKEIAWAEDDFKNVYQITYEILPDTEAKITQDAEITNLKNDVIATNYTLTVKQMEIYNVQAKDSKGKMEIEEIKEGSGVTIRVKFNENIVGKNRTNKFTVTYNTLDVASKIGEIYTIKIPKVAGLETVREYNVDLIIPQSMGPVIYLTPEPAKTENLGGKIVYHFNKHSLEESGISASFGKYQLINYKLVYQLENTKPFAIVTEIALPPDLRERQQINHKQLFPEPIRVRTDKDGNMLALYKLHAGEKKEITLIGSARLLGKQIRPEFGGNFQDIPPELIKLYTKKQPYWEVDHPEIQAVKNKLYDNELNVAQNAQKIYAFVVENLTYNFNLSDTDLVIRYGALEALKKENPVACMEFTDLFITLARAMGIPSRELNGYAINSQDKKDLPLSIKLSSGDTLHAWPEFYDPNLGWIAVDPTWGNTSKLDYFSKLDNNHFVFSIKGADSEYPLPAGIYRYDSTKRLVLVEISQLNNENDFSYKPGLYRVISFNPIKYMQGINRYIVKNMGGTSIYNLTGKYLAPYQVASIYLPKETFELKFENTNKEELIEKIVVLETNPRKYIISPSAVFYAFLLGLVLCSFCYYYLIQPMSQKKQRTHRRNRPQGPNQRQNQRLK